MTDTLTDAERIAVLNRIDQQWQCDVMIWHDEYCGIPEWDPFTWRCAEHSPDYNSGWRA